MKESKAYSVSFRCHYCTGNAPNYTQHYQKLPLRDIPKWMEAYRFTHHDCLSITCKIWWNDCPPLGEYPAGAMA